MGAEKRGQRYIYGHIMNEGEKLKSNGVKGGLLIKNVLPAVIRSLNITFKNLHVKQNSKCER